MHRMLLVVVCVLIGAQPAWAVGGVRRQRDACCQTACTVACQPHSNACCKARVETCYCLKEELATYPKAGGGLESLYLGEQHDDGCSELGCQAPLTTYLTGDPNQSSQECLIPNSCTGGRKGPKRGLAAPLDPGFTPQYAGRLGEIATILKTFYVEFKAGSKDRFAQVFIIELPVDSQRRPHQPHRIIAIGYEVTSVPGPHQPFAVKDKYVQNCEKNPYLFCVEAGIKFGVIVAE